MTSENPNILIFMVDQLTAHVLNAYGGSVCKTPNIDALADRGVVFENAYCNYPLCAPSRFSMMSGRLPSRIGAYDNGAEFRASTPTFAHYLRRAGYYTSISGKMHFVGPDQLHGFEERLTTEIYPGDFSWTPTVSYEDLDQDDERRFSAGVSSVETVMDAAPKARSMQIDYDDDVVHHAIRELYVRARSTDKRPFMMTVSLTHPHDPYVITQEYWDRYTDDTIDAPRVPFIPLAARDRHSQSLYTHYGMDKTEISEPAYRRARRGYYGMISYVDELFGRLNTALQDSGYGNNTVLIFTSDHGDMIGERGMWFKKTLYEPAVNVPLIISHPGYGPGRVNAPVSLVDLFPTVLEFAGICQTDLQTPIDGRSLVAALNGTEEIAPILVEHIDGGTAAPRVMVRDGAMKFIFSPAYPNMLFDLVADPTELKNLAGEPAFADIEAHLLSLVQDNWDFDKLTEDVIADHAARRIIDEAQDQGRRESWDFAPRPLIQNTNYVRHGDRFPDLERRGYLPYPNSKP